MTVDNFRRRNRIAGVAAGHFREEIGRAAANVQKAYPGRPVTLDARLALAALDGVIAALAGETDVNKLNIDPYSVPAMAVAALTTTAKTEPEA